MVQEWDTASRETSAPSKIEKQAARALEALAKIAASSAAGFNLLGQSNKSEALKPPNKPLGKSFDSGGGAKPSPFPGDYKPSFLDNSGAAAQRGSSDKLQAGESLTMPS